jgi:hypothetical protein
MMPDYKVVDQRDELRYGSALFGPVDSSQKGESPARNLFTWEHDLHCYSKPGYPLGKRREGVSHQ